jgi:phage/plasmid-like protein (TIGR03299 family)
VNPEVPVFGHFATVRMDTLEVLGVVGSRYTPIQNKDAFVAFDTLVGEGEAIYHTAGVLGKGERIWLLAKLPDHIRVNGNDIVEKYLLLTNAHDGSCSVRVKLTPIRVVCENTLTLALSGSEQEVRICHIAHAEERLKKAHEILGLTNKLYAELEQILNQMGAKRMTGGMMADYVRRVFPGNPESESHSRTYELREKVLELVEVGKGADMSRGTLWGVYNAVAEYIDYYRQPKAGASVRLKSIWFGAGEQRKRDAFKVAVAMLN